MRRLFQLFRVCRTSSRLIQSVLAAFVLSLGVASVAPAVQAHQLSPDQQIICLGAGGMKVVTVAVDGSMSDAQTTNVIDCPLCLPLQAFLPEHRAESGAALTSFAQPILYGVQPHLIFESRAPPARAPPSL